MRSTAPTILLAAILTVTATAAVQLLIEARSEYPQEESAVSFQRLVGGLGFGPALDLSQCPCTFDPRLEAACGLDLEPVPAGGCFCPQHGTSIFYYPPLHGGPGAHGEARHAHLP
jgi:hypothetical protein